MILKERISKMSKAFVHCQCGGKAIYSVGTVRQKIGQRIILVHNVPHYSCSSCGSIGYDVDIKLSPVLKYAYKNNLSETNYK